MENKLPNLSGFDRDEYMRVGLKIKDDVRAIRLQESQYLVFEDGRVYNLNFNRFMIPHRPDAGYLRYSLSSIRKSPYKVHSLVAKLFVPNPKRLKVINHIDGDKMNNYAPNLEWTTVKGNNEHAQKTGLVKSPKNTPSISKAIIQNTLSGEFIAEYLSIRDASRLTGIPHCSIANCAKGGHYIKKRPSGELVWWNSNSAGGFKWEFKDSTNRVRYFFSEPEVHIIISMVCDQFEAPIDGREVFVKNTIDHFLLEKRKHKQLITNPTK